MHPSSLMPPDCQIDRIAENVIHQVRKEAPLVSNVGICHMAALLLEKQADAVVAMPGNEISSQTRREATITLRKAAQRALKMATKPWR